MAGNPIVHVEIPGSDPGKAAEFYRDVFGWNINTSWPEYPMFEAEGGPGGGFVRTGGTEGPGYEIDKVTVYLGVDDVDAKMREIEAAGGSMAFPKTEIPGMGWFAFFTDPSGNRLAIYQGAAGQPD